RGREQPDPERPGEAMCLDLEAVKLAQAAGEPVERVVCGSLKEGAARCPFRVGPGLCGYYRQGREVSQADIVIAAHEAAFHTPAGATKNLALAVFDEAWWQDGIRAGRGVGVEGLAEAVLGDPVYRFIPGGRQAVDEEATNDLHALRAKLEHALMASPEGYVTRRALVAAGLTVQDCSTARGLEWNRKRENLMRPGMSPEDRRQAAEEAGVNAQLPRFAAMWTVMADLLARDDAEAATGRAELAWKKDREGRERWTLSVSTVAELSTAVEKVPALLLDATMPADLVRAYMPRLEAAEPIRVKAPFMEVRQIRGGFGKTTLLPGGLKLTVGEDGQPAQKLPPLLGQLRDFVAGETRGERSLVITYMDAEAAFAGLPGVEVAHFNDVAGRDEWRDVRHLFVIGRPRPRSDQVRVLAAALTGEPVQVAESHRETRGVRMVDGKAGAMEVRAYANPAAEAVSAAITDAEVIQAVGRGRGIRRTEGDPLRVWIMADVVTPLVLDELLDWREMGPSAVERMALRGLVLSSPRDAAALYPDLFPTEEAAKKAFQRAGLRGGDFGDNPLRNIILRGMSRKSPLGFTYRPEGRGQQTRHGWARPGTEPADLWELLRSVFGELAHFETDELEPPPEPAELGNCWHGEGDPPAPTKADEGAAAPISSPPQTDTPRGEAEEGVGVEASRSGNRPHAPPGPEHAAAAADVTPVEEFSGQYARACERHGTDPPGIVIDKANYRAQKADQRTEVQG
ncbi:hypothetical protein, partial [Roseomonas chloroacetimidivorans]|uniref:hypothetical protein n=1 Tax=Roseomonas chloroacetimidivorans TaxID=1766656 RepID=UPI003C7151F3